MSPLVRLKSKYTNAYPGHRQKARSDIRSVTYIRSEKGSPTSGLPSMRPEVVYLKRHWQDICTRTKRGEIDCANEGGADC
jgi:hypothetical protein